MLIEEVSFREWVVCKVRRRKSLSAVSVTVRESFARQRVRTTALVTRRADDRRGDVAVEGLTRREQRRKPERRIPEIKEVSFEEFERWKNAKKLALTGGTR
ncbi:MAG: hypothetical protein CVU16_13095 [Betaproteobacteria bacterium HGW-Betaproteobacteria-10]|nr:MAG: hypothetical protein CVU16_13095 [Betaproteobacteria bacterium HGW-Betaproteobacteria-10]